MQKSKIETRNNRIREREKESLQCKVTIDFGSSLFLVDWSSNGWDVRVVMMSVESDNVLVDGI